jgi:hypothetical protein
MPATTIRWEYSTIPLYLSLHGFFSLFLSCFYFLSTPFNASIHPAAPFAMKLESCPPRIQRTPSSCTA